MTHHHGPHAPGSPAGLDGLTGGTVLLVGALLLGGVAYVVAVRGGRPAPWPAARTVRWLLGVATAATGAVLLGVPDLRLHVGGHLLLGMLAPLLLVTAAPMTLVLRTVARRRARVLGRVLRSRPVAVVSHPVVAGLLDTGGLWLMYRTDLTAAVPAWLMAVHVLLAGYLFAFALVGADPAPHRAALGVRAAVLVVAVAAHDVLAKLLYAAPPGETPVAHAEAAGMLLYYGGTPVHVALLVLLGREWAAAQRRAAARRAAGHAAVSTRLRPPGAPGGRTRG